MTMADFLRPPATTNNPQTTGTSSGNLHDNAAAAAAAAALPPYTIRATKKGGVPCVVESRKHHKVVVLSNLEGDVSALLSALQKALGTGGVRKGNTIEVQGEHHLEKIRLFCLKSGCVVGANKQNKAEAAAAAGKASKGQKATETETATATSKPVVDIAMAPLSQKQIKAMKPATLREHLAARQLSTQGNKKELLARLVAAATAATAVASSHSNSA
jgi:translation initiation factor 1 (eIF-1/SUI1)